MVAHGRKKKKKSLTESIGLYNAGFRMLESFDLETILFWP